MLKSRRMTLNKNKEKNTDQDTALVDEAKKGNFDAFEQLVNRHEKRVYTLSMNILKNREDAEDAVQSTFINALEHLDTFRQESSFSTWITRIASNKALHILRKRKNHPVSLDAATEENEDGFIPHPEYIADWRDDPAKKMEQRELKSILDKAIDGLPDKHRLVFMLRDVVGMNIAETGQALGISIPNVKVRLLRARLALRETLTRQFGDETKRVIQEHNHEGEHPDRTSAMVLLQSYQVE